MSCSHRFRDDDNRLVLPRLIQSIRRSLRDRGLTGDPWAVVRRNAELRVEQLATSVYLNLPAELRATDRDLAWRLCYAAAASSDLVRSSSAVSPEREVVA